MSEKRYNVWDIDGTIFLEDHKEGSYHIGQAGNVDINCLNDIAKRLNDLTDENEELKKRNENQYKQLQHLWSLMEAKDWETLSEMVNQMKEDEKRLQQEWKCYE